MTDSISEQLKKFGWQALALEDDLAKLEKSGVSIGHSLSLQTKEIVDADLFENDIRANAAKMADFYKLYFCLENTIRRLMTERLIEKYGAGWWELRVPESVKRSVAELQQREKDSPVTLRSPDPLSYTTFGELIQIFDMNWEHFSDTIRSQKAMRKTLSELGNIRNVIAHSCILEDDEIKRFELLIKDWMRIQM